MQETKLKTDSTIRAIPTPDKTIEIYDEEVSGLILRVTKTGHKSFALRYRFEKSKQMTIGKHGDWSLSEARKEARKLKRDIASGIDPLIQKQEKKRAVKVTSFTELAEQFKQI